MTPKQKEDKYTITTQIKEIRALMIADGIRQQHGNELSVVINWNDHKIQEFVRKKVDQTLKDAQSDISVKKGLISYLNW